jgi:predicted flap endonuclease-1-like 5' DNA nuclease
VTLRENIDSRDARVKELNLELHDSQVETQQFLTRLTTLQKRVEPLSQEIQKQQVTIYTLEERLALAALAEPAPRYDVPETAPPARVEPKQTEPMAPDPQMNGPVDDDDSQDDLKKIRGIGPALERRLNETGIRQYRQIAELSDEELTEIAAKISVSPAVAARYDWRQQARSLQ